MTLLAHLFDSCVYDEVMILISEKDDLKVTFVT